MWEKEIKNKREGLLWSWQSGWLNITRGKEAPSHRKSNRFPNFYPNNLSDPKDLVKAHFVIFALGGEE